MTFHYRWKVHLTIWHMHDCCSHCPANLSLQYSFEITSSANGAKKSNCDGCASKIFQVRQCKLDRVKRTSPGVKSNVRFNSNRSKHQILLHLRKAFSRNKMTAI